MGFIKVDTGLELGTDFLINENAYFLGGILAANETTLINGSTYCIAPVRHNREYITDEELEAHFNHVRKIASKLSKETLMATSFSRNGISIGKFNKRMKGFATFFKCNRPVNSESIANSIKEAIINSPDDVKKSFIVGLFDGRGAIDINQSNRTIRYISLDCDNPNVARILIEILDNYGLSTNYNMARERLEGGRRRENQLRISDPVKYLNKVGFISIKKFAISTSCFTYSIKEENHILDGLKTIII